VTPDICASTWSLLTLTLFAVGLASSGSLRAQNVPIFQTSTNLMHVDAEVIGPNGNPLTGLTKEDFRVMDESQEQTIVAFSAGEEPLDIILLFDISGSMEKQVRKVAAVAREGLQELRGGDRVSVMVFNTKARTVGPFSDNFKYVEQDVTSVLRFEFRGGTRIQDALDDAANRFIQGESREHRRRAVLVVTDDFGRPSHRKKSIIENLWGADALVSGLVVPNPVGRILAPLSGAVPGRIGGAEDLIEQTGGDLIRSDDLSQSFPEMMHRIRSRYTLYYKLPEGQVGSLRNIDMRLSDAGCQRFPKARVLARHEYRLRQQDQYGFTKR